MSTIPTMIRSLHGDAIPVLQADLGGPRGVWDAKDGTITIAPDAPEIAKWDVLLHEMLHAVDDATTAPNGRARRVPHWWIEQAAPMLFELMACSGMLRIDPDEAAAWMRTVRQSPQGTAQ